MFERIKYFVHEIQTFPIEKGLDYRHSFIDDKYKFIDDKWKCIKLI